MPRLILLIGIPGSGKSSLAHQLQQFGYTVISTDQIRGQLFGDPAVQGNWPLIWAEVERQMRAVGTANTTDSASQTGLAVYDATNVRRQSRRQLVRLARSIGFSEIIGFWLHPPLLLCLERNQQRSRQVPETVIRRMDRQLWTAPPKRAEGLDLLLHYDGAQLPDLTIWLALVEQHLTPYQVAHRVKPEAEYGNCTNYSVKTEPESQQSLIL